MKGHLYRRICEYRTLWKAWNKIKGKGSGGGIDGVTLRDFEANIDANLRALSEELTCLSYVPEPSLLQLVEKPGGGEKRRIVLPTVRDKVVQEAVRSTIEPIFESMFRPSSFAYRPGKGPKRAIAALANAIRTKSNPWVATADIDDFFDSIDPNLLLNMVGERIWEDEVLRLIELWLKMGIMSGLSWSSPERGIPQGTVISPLLSNIYLHCFDCHMEKAGHEMIRYADDFAIVEEGRGKADASLREAEEFLNERLFLGLNKESKSIRADYEGFNFLGFFHKIGKRRISDEKLEHIQERIRSIIRSNKDLSEITRQLSEAVRGWREYYESGDCGEQFAFLDRFIMGELRIYFGRHDCSAREGREKLAGLELFGACGERERENLINLAIAGSRLRERRTTRAVEPPPLERKIASKKREYSKKAIEASLLIASSPGSFLGKTSKRAFLKVGGKRARETPFFALRHIIIASQGVSISSDLIKHCAERGIPITYVDYHGRPYAQILSPSHPVYRYTTAQAQALADERGAHLARCFAEGKIRNQINLLKYYRKYRQRRQTPFDDGCEKAIAEMRNLLKKLDEIARDEEVDYERKRARIFGIEGQSAAFYWNQVKTLLGDRVYFTGREKRGAADLVNSLLNYGYGILYSQIYHAVFLVGLNPNIGFLHKAQPGKPALVFDLIEEMRQPVVDRTIFAMVNKGRRLGMSGVYLDRETRELLIREIHARLEKKTDFRGTRKTYRDIITYQVNALAEYLEGGKKYRPFVERW